MLVWAKKQKFLEPDSRKLDRDEYVEACDTFNVAKGKRKKIEEIGMFVTDGLCKGNSRMHSRTPLRTYLRATSLPSGAHCFTQTVPLHVPHPKPG